MLNHPKPSGIPPVNTAPCCRQVQHSCGDWLQLSAEPSTVSSPCRAQVSPGPCSSQEASWDHPGSHQNVWGRHRRSGEGSSHCHHDVDAHLSVPAPAAPPDPPPHHQSPCRCSAHTVQHIRQPNNFTPLLTHLPSHNSIQAEGKCFTTHYCRVFQFHQHKIEI